MLRALATIVILLAGPAAIAQDAPDSPDEATAYVPTDLADAHATLRRLLKTSDIDDIRIGSESDVSGYHMSLGLWLRNRWGLWHGSRLARFFNRLGIHHPDDMSGLVLETFWCELNGKSWGLYERVNTYQEYWRLQADPPRRACPICQATLEVIAAVDEPGKTLRRVHLARCKNGHFRAWELDRGWFAPSRALLTKAPARAGGA